MEVNCPICLLAVSKDNVSLLPCKHEICSNCIKEFVHYSNKCPICNKDFLNFQDKEEIHELTKEELDDISQNKKDFFINESFDCLTKEEILPQLETLKKLADDISIKLFPPRAPIGSEKESEVLGKIYEKINETYNIYEEEEFDGKSTAENINNIILEIKNLKNGIYRFGDKESAFEGEDDKFKCQFSIEFCDKGRKGGKKRKKKFR